MLDYRPYAHLISTRRLNYLSDSKMLVGFLSDMPERSMTDWLLVTSHITGREVIYTMISHNTDPEGELTHWNFVPSDRDTSLPALRIFND